MRSNVKWPRGSRDQKSNVPLFHIGDRRAEDGPHRIHRHQTHRLACWICSSKNKNYLRSNKVKFGSKRSKKVRRESALVIRAKVVSGILRGDLKGQIMAQSSFEVNRGHFGRKSSNKESEVIGGKRRSNSDWEVIWGQIMTQRVIRVKKGSKRPRVIWGQQKSNYSYQCCTIMFCFGGIFDRSRGTCWTWRVWNDRIRSWFYNWAAASSKASATLYWWRNRWRIHWGNATAATSAAKERDIAGYWLRCSGTHWCVIKGWKCHTISQSGR